MVAIAAQHGIPVHTDAVQAVGQLPVDFAASGVDALTVTGHKLGGPLRRRRARAAPRASTLDPAAARRRPGARRPLRHPRHAGDRRLRRRGRERREAGSAERAPACAALRDDLVRRVARGGARRAPQRRPGSTALPGNAHLSFPGCEGDSLLMLLDARGIECSTGSACSAGVPSRPTCCSRWARDAAGARLAALLPRPHLDRGRRRRAASRRSARSSSAPAAPARQRGPGATEVRVLAAMSGGVDSAVAAARAAEAGHDVTGIHLALSRNPASYRSGARGCCTIEDAHDARRAADVIGIPFYVWDLSERFHEDVVEDFMAEYAAGRTPNPCLRCNEKIKFAAVLDRALGARLRRRRAPATTPGSSTAATVASCTGPSTRQGPVLRARRARPASSSRHALFPLGDAPQADGARRGRAPRALGRRQARQPRHLLRRRRRHRRLAARAARRRPGRDRRPGRSRRAAATTGRSPSRSASGAGCGSAGPAADGEPRYVLDIEPVPARSPSGRASGSRSTG